LKSSLPNASPPSEVRLQPADIQAVCQQQGFELCGVLSIAQAQGVARQAGSSLQAWLQAGNQADMHWIDRSVPLRSDPALLMPNTQSLVVVGLNYYPPATETATTPKVARYARGQDYHRVIKHKLRHVLKALQQQNPSLKGRPLVDSAPVMERAMAVAAGLGWQGKHSNLINPSHGSWLFLGVLLLDAVVEDVIEADPVDASPTLTPDFCGRCTRCISACPTQAIDPVKRTVNSQQCLAYWTIENTAPALPPGIADNLNGWMFGCDICQEVCPWNLKHQHPTAEPAFLAQNPVLTQDPLSLLTMDDTTFKQAFAHSAALRTGLLTLQRNIQAILND
jgi:epoxyqueuosine reductase